MWACYGYRDEFYDEIRLACFAIVVETIDNLYYKEPDADQTDVKWKIVQEQCNTLEARISIYYLRSIRISNNMVKILQKYYQNETEIITEEIEAEYQIFIHAGDKPNYYKSDEEIKQVLPSLAEKIRQEDNIVKVSRYADEYFIWSEHLQLDVNQLKDDYKTKLSSMIYDKIMNGGMEFLTYGAETFCLESKTNKVIVDEACKTAQYRAINEYEK